MTSEELKAAQKELGLKNSDLRAIFDVSPATPSNWRSGAHRIPKSVSIVLSLMQTAKRLGIKLPLPQVRRKLKPASPAS